MVDFTEKEKTFLRNLKRDRDTTKGLSVSEMETMRKVFCSYPETGQGLFEVIGLAYSLGYRRGGR